MKRFHLMLIVFGSLLAGMCQAQISPPVAKGDHRLNLGSLYGPPRDRIMVLDLTIKQDGKVGDVDVVSGFFDDVYKARALPAVRGIQFAPATLNGAPVEFHGYRFVLASRATFTTSTHPGFESNYQKVTALTNAGDFAAAEALVQEQIKNRITTVFEYAFLNETLIPIYVKLQRPYDALRASRIATLKSGFQQTEYFTGSHIQANDPNWPYFLPKELLVDALRKRFALAMSLERFGEAGAAYRELTSLQPLADDDPISVLASNLEKRRRSPQPMTVHGKIEHGEWEFSPTRRAISVEASPATAIHSVDVNCNLHRETRNFETAKWTLPPPWGACTLLFHGDENADIVVTENMLQLPFN
ncbi:MAG: hypothetical protein ABI616_06480 [Pseudomonadota bacterium]